MSKQAVEVDRDKAKALLVQLGVPKADKYDDARLVGKLQSLDATDDTADPGKFKKTYAKIVEANKAGNDLVLTPELEKKSKASKAATAKAATNGKAKGKKATAKKASAKGSRSSAPKDEWGSNPESNRGKMNAVIRKVGAKGINSKTLAEKSEASTYHANAHLRFLEEKGFIKKNKDGAYVPK